MQRVISGRIALLAVFCALVILLGGCARGLRSDEARAPVVLPESFDVVLTAAKEGQFDYENVPLTAESLRSALNYRKDQSLPMATVLLKRGEKTRVKDVHIVALARISVALGFKAFVEEDGEINEIRTTTKAAEGE